MNFSLIWLTELTLFLYDSQNWTFLNMTQGMNFFFQIWLKELIFFQKNKNSKNWMFFQYFSKNWFFYDSKDWIFLRRKELNPFFFEKKKKIKELNLFFSRIWLKELNLVSKKKRLKELNSFEMTHRIELLFMNLFSIWLKEWKSFCSMTPRVQLFLCSNMTPRIEPFFFFNLTQRIVCFFDVTQKFELLFEYDSRNWIFFWVWLQGLNLFFRNMTHRIELFKWLIELNLFLRTTFQYDSKCWTLQMTHRVELFLWIWRKELNPSLNMTQRIELFV